MRRLKGDQAHTILRCAGCEYFSSQAPITVEESFDYTDLRVSC